MKNLQKSKVLHYNLPQIRSSVVRAKTEILLASRRTGKTTGAFAPRTSWGAFRLPRSLGAIVMPSFKQFLTSFITSYLDGLEQLGYIEGRDYVIDRRGPQHWAQPFHRPKKYEHVIHWRSGSADIFISQDIQGAGAGLTLDRMAVDEAKHINGQRLEEETMAAMSGHPQHFAGRPEHRSLFIASDRPHDSRGKWFFKYLDQVDPRVIKAIMQLEIESQLLQQKILSGTLSKSSVVIYESKINKIQRMADALRSVATYWHEASTLDNIHVVGIEYLRNMANTMEVEPFTLSILNQESTYVSGGFYPDLSDDRHTYHPKASSYTTSLGLDREARERLRTADSRHDAELMPRLPLEIGMDYGSTFNCIAVGQMFGNKFRIDNGLHVYGPEKTKDVVNLFIEYYRYHICKEVIYYYDNTAIGGDGKSDFTYSEIVIKTLRHAGWQVTPVDIGRQPTHAYRYEAWANILGLHGNPPFHVSWNASNCEDMLISLHMTAAKQDMKGFRKNKAPERDQTLDQAHAPHYSDACDTLVVGRMIAMKTKLDLPLISGFIG